MNVFCRGTCVQVEWHVESRLEKSLAALLMALLRKGRTQISAVVTGVERRLKFNKY